MNEKSRKTQITLEDLLRVKRAERPPAEFWTEFERGMRTKQLAAIVEPRPWWAPFIRVGTRVSRYQLPVGAAAILALTFVTLREYRTADVRPVYEPAVATVAALPVQIPTSQIAATLSPNASADANVAMMVAESPSRTEGVVGSEESTLVSDGVGGSSHVSPAPVELTPSALYIAENFAAARADDPEVDQVLGRSVRTLDNRVVQVEPLAQVNPGESRRSRLIGGATWLASAGSSTDSTLRTDDHSARRLTERRLSESDAIRRIDVDGSRLTVKF
jgi:hypothetical protein